MANFQESKKRLQEDFIILKRMNSDLIQNLTDYSNKHNLSEVVFMQNLTYSKCIDILSQVKNLVLTDDNYNAILISQSQEKIDDVAKNIDIQLRHHKEVRNVFDSLISTN